MEAEEEDGAPPSSGASSSPAVYRDSTGEVVLDISQLHKSPRGFIYRGGRMEETSHPPPSLPLYIIRYPSLMLPNPSLKIVKAELASYADFLDKCPVQPKLEVTSDWLAQHGYGMWLVKNVRDIHVALVILAGHKLSLFLCAVPGMEEQILQELRYHTFRMGYPYLELYSFRPHPGHLIQARLILEGVPANVFTKIPFLPY